MKTLLVFLLSAAAGLATTLTGTLNGPDGSGINGTLYMSLSQQAALLSTGGCGGPAEIVPGVLGPQNGYSVVIKIVNGAMQSPPPIYGNDCMLPGGLYYNVQVVDNNGNTYFTDKWQIVGSSINIGTIVSVVISGTTQTLGSTGFVQLVPAGTQIINQPAGSYLGVNTLAVSGTVTFPDGSVCNSSGCFAANTMLLVGDQTAAGNKTFSGNTEFNNADVAGNFTSSTIGTASFLLGNYTGASSGGCTGGTSCTSLWGTLQSGISVTFTDNAGNAWPAASFASAHAGGINFISPADRQWVLGGSLIPGNTVYNVGTAALPWNQVNAQTVNVGSKLTIGSSGAFYNKIFIGADVSCTGVTSGWQGVRTDTQQIELCISGTLYKIQAM